MFSPKGHCTDQCTNLSYLSSVVEGLPPPHHHHPQCAKAAGCVVKIDHLVAGTWCAVFSLYIADICGDKPDGRYPKIDHVAHFKMSWSTATTLQPLHINAENLFEYNDTDVSQRILFLTGSSADSGFSRACFALSCSCAVSQAMFFFYTE